MSTGLDIIRRRSEENHRPPAFLASGSGGGEQAVNPHKGENAMTNMDKRGCRPRRLDERYYEIHVRRHDGTVAIYELSGTREDAQREVAQHKSNGYWAWWAEMMSQLEAMSAGSWS